MTRSRYYVTEAEIAGGAPAKACVPLCLCPIALVDAVLAECQKTYPEHAPWYRAMVENGLCLLTRKVSALTPWLCLRGCRLPPPVNCHLMLPTLPPPVRAQMPELNWYKPEDALCTRARARAARGVPSH
jgi:hypothetical protein